MLASMGFYYTINLAQSMDIARKLSCLLLHSLAYTGCGIDVYQYNKCYKSSCELSKI